MIVGTKRCVLIRHSCTAIIVITLSVGLGVNAGVLSFARGVLIGAVPYDEDVVIVGLSFSYRVGVD